MDLRTKIYTTSNPKWIRKNLPFIEQSFRQAKHLDVAAIQVERIELASLPLLDNEPDWAWLKQNVFEDGYNAVGLHLSRKDRKRFKLPSNIGGSFNTEFDDVLDFYLVADEGQKAKAYSFDEFTRILIHEVCHGFDNWKHGKPNINVHHWDYDLKKIHELPAQYDFNVMPKLQTIELIKLLLVEIVKRLQVVKCARPVDPKWQVSQKFGTPNTRYPLTKHHVGTDFAVPIGEPCYAIADGRIVRVGTTRALGNYLYFEFQHQNQTYTARYLHLSQKPKVGIFKQGDTIGLTGNTGEGTGAHLHIDVMKGAFDLAGVNFTNFKERFVDPETLWN